MIFFKPVSEYQIFVPIFLNFMFWYKIKLQFYILMFFSPQSPAYLQILNYLYIFRILLSSRSYLISPNNFVSIYNLLYIFIIFHHLSSRFPTLYLYYFMLIVSMYFLFFFYLYFLPFTLYPSTEPTIVS